MFRCNRFWWDSWSAHMSQSHGKCHIDWHINVPSNSNWCVKCRIFYIFDWNGKRSEKCEHGCSIESFQKPSSEHWAFSKEFDEILTLARFSIHLLIWWHKFIITFHVAVLFQSIMISLFSLLLLLLHLQSPLFYVCQCVRVKSFCVTVLCDNILQNKTVEGNENSAKMGCLLNVKMIWPWFQSIHFQKWVHFYFLQWFFIALVWEKKKNDVTSIYNGGLTWPLWW